MNAPPNRKTCRCALEAASRGSICIHARCLPEDFDFLAASLRDSGPTVQVFLCLSNHDRIRDLLSPPLEIPSLDQRSSDLDRLVGEFLADATQSLGVRRMRFSGRVRDSILYRVKSLAELEKAVLRLVALKAAPNLSQAAERLHVAPVSLNRWVHRRGSMAVLRDVECLEYDDDAEETAGRSYDH